MRNVDILVNGLISHVDYDSALTVLRDASNWISAYPLTSGRYTGKLIPFKRHLAPIVLDNLKVIALMPFVDNQYEDLSDRIIQKFAFAAIVSLSSYEHEAVEFALINGTWLYERSAISEVVWSRPGSVGAFDTLVPAEARTL